MALWALLLAVLFTVLDCSAADGSCSVGFRTNKYIPNYANRVESTDLKVEYRGKNVSCGSTVNVLQASQPPTLYFDVTYRCLNATVLAFSPDPVVDGPYVLWLIYNVPTKNLKNGFTTPSLGNTRNNGYVAANYIIQKDPTGGTGVRTNTVIFFVYCQYDYIKDRKKYIRPFRGMFDVKQLARDKRLWNPVAGLYHRFSATGINLPKVVTLPIQI